MFRSRTSSAKPGDDLVANFRQQFPEVVTATTAGPVLPTAAPNHPLVSAPTQERTQPGQDAFRDQDPTPRATNEPWRFTPSLLDPHSFSFASFANAPSGYYTPTPGGTNTLYHPQAGDLHTPTLGLMGLNTPLSMPTSEAALSGGAPALMDLQGFQSLHTHQFHHFNPFIQAPAPQPPQQQPHPQAFAPAAFIHQDTGYGTMDQDGSPMDSDPSDERMTSIDTTLQSSASPIMAVSARQFTGFQMTGTLPSSAEKFRFHSTLNAPTAMIKHADEIPVTYLNKGQAYSLSILDTNSSMPITRDTRYRTYVRISFEDDQQRQKPGVCWTLWKEGRGTNEAHQRGGKLQAVEYVEAGQPSEGDEKRTRVELESSSFDGFSVVWVPGASGAPEVNIAVRFNFLSTDFSHSKGVKGIPVRLCAKTALFPVEPNGAPASPAADMTPEICYCKVKLFRDHGAERKLSNDVAHVKKTIDKLKQQIAQAETGMKDFGKRKRTSASQSKDVQRPGKVLKHKRTWSMSSASSSGGTGGRMPVEEDLHFKLQTLQDMFTSTRPVSVLYLRGDDLDDPDLHPVSLNGKSPEPLKIETRDERPVWQVRSGRSSVAGSSLVSPSPSSLSLASQASAMPSGPWSGFDSVTDHVRKTIEQPTKVGRADDAGNLSGWIEALGVDPSYRPPPERIVKPVACFYMRRQEPSATPESQPREYHRAVYLGQRTLRDFVDRVGAKWGLDTTRVLRCVHIPAGRAGLEVEIDDDFVKELCEGQDMILEVEDLGSDGSVVPSRNPTSPIKREWEMALDSREDDERVQRITRPGVMGEGLVLRLLF